MNKHPRKLPPLVKQFIITQQAELPEINPNKDQSSLNITSSSKVVNSSLPSIITEPTPILMKAVLALIPVVILCFILLIILTVYLYPTQRTIVIVGTNDIHGKAFPTILFREDTQKEYEYGGLVYMSKLINIVSDQYQQNILYLDSGDQFQGGIESSKLVSSGEIMNDFYKRANLYGSAIGNHQFDEGPSFMFNFFKGRSSANFAANIRSEKGEDNFLPSQKGDNIYQFPNGIKIGIIGLTTIETPTTTAAFISNKFPPYQFLTYPEVVVNKSKQLKRKGAHAVILVTHVGDNCTSDFNNKVRNSSTAEPPCPPDQLTKLMNSLPQGTINGIVQGHRHRIAHNYYKGIPYMGTNNGGYYVNFMYLKFNNNNELISSSIEGPVPVCQKIFENTKRCDYLDAEQLKTAGKLVSWKFHGQDVVADEELSNTFKAKWGQKMSVYLEKIVNNQINLFKIADGEYQLGNLFTNILHQLVPDADFTVLNTGGFRTQWYPGVITYEQYYNMFPFDNEIVSFQINGTELINTINILQSGIEFFPIWNIQTAVNIDSQSMRTVASSKFMNNISIDPNKTYKGVTIKYLLDGGDRFSQVIGTIYTGRNVQKIGEFRSTLKPLLKNMVTIKANTLIDPSNPRLIITKI